MVFHFWQVLTILVVIPTLSPKWFLWEPPWVLVSSSDDLAVFSGFNRFLRFFAPKNPEKQISAITDEVVLIIYPFPILGLVLGSFFSYPSPSDT